MKLRNAQILLQIAVLFAAQKLYGSAVTVTVQVMGSVTGQAYRFERARVLRDVGSDKS